MLEILLFVSNMNVCNVSNILKIVLFADDTNIFTSNKDIANLYSETNKKLNMFCTWLCINKLPINMEKTNYIVFLVNMNTL